MHFNETDEGDYRIYTGALEAPQGDGYVAAVVVNKVRGVPGRPLEAYRDTSLAGGHRWLRPEEALSYAMDKARAIVRAQRLAA